MLRIGMDRSEFRRSRCKLFEQTEEKFCKSLLYSALTCLNLVNIQSETVKYYSFLQKQNRMVCILWILTVLSSPVNMTKL
jgi:hypothetical protein